jgi:hypothetical protein
MRVLVADQELEMLEAIARAFEVDVATSKATCIDLLRANDFDVLVACERLSDGSGLELLSHVGQRWPQVLRILAIEPARRAMLRGRLGPFKLFDTIPYPIDEVKLEAALMRAVEALGAPEPEESPAAAAPVRASAPVPAPRPSPPQPRNVPPPSQRSLTDSARAKPGVTVAPTAAKRPPQGPGQKPSQMSPQQRPGTADRSRGTSAPAYPPLPAKGSKIVPLGSPAAPEYRIVPHDYRAETASGELRTRHDDAHKPHTLHEKAASLAAEAMAAVVRYMKPQSSPPAQSPPKAPPRRKR